MAHVRRVLEAIEAVIEKRATESHLDLELSGVAGTKRVREMALGDLIAAREKYLGELGRLRVAENRRYPKNVIFRFV